MISQVAKLQRQVKALQDQVTQSEAEKEEERLQISKTSKGNELLEAFNREHWHIVDGFVDRGEVNNDHMDLMVLDQGGMSLLHHAARRCHVGVVKLLCEHAPALAFQLTYANGRPSSWLAVACLADKPIDKSNPHFYNEMIDCLKCLWETMDNRDHVFITFRTASDMSVSIVNNFVKKSFRQNRCRSISFRHEPSRFSKKLPPDVL